MEAYPITLRIAGKPAIVVGGGRIARRKIRRLLESGAEVTVISPDLCTEVHELYRCGEIDWRQKLFEPADLENAFIIMAASADREVNRLVSSAAKPFQLVNIADDPEGGNFHVPASLTRGKLSIAVATQGASPILARKVRDELADQFGPEFDDYLDFLASVRRRAVHELDLPTDMKNYILEHAASDTCKQSKTERQSLLFYLHLFTLGKSSS